MFDTMELLLWQAERKELREHMLDGAYREAAPYIGAIHDAVLACVQHDSEQIVEIAGEPVAAGEVVAAYDLESYVWRRWTACWN